jgi:hypothetical protein
MSTSINKKAVIGGLELRLDKAIDGLKNALPAGFASLTMRGASRAIVDLIQTAENLDKPWKDVRAARSLIAAIIQKRPMDEATALAFLTDLEAGVAAAFGVDSQVLVQFGFTPRKKRAPLSPEKLVVRAAKAKLTRAKRHTLGSRQKEALRAAETPAVTIGPDGTLIAPPATSVPATSNSTASK